MKSYTHRVAYYETDKMGITHHSNYIRWMEEARVDFLDQIGWNYRRLEENGIVSPVLNVNCRYRHSTTFDDIVSITAKVKDLTMVRMTISYEMKKSGTDEIVCTAESQHCFLDTAGKPIPLESSYPEFYKALKDNMEQA